MAKSSKILPIRSIALFLLFAGFMMSAQDKPAAQGNAKPAQPAAANGASQIPAGATYVGAETCKNCHEDVYKQHFEYTPHYKLIAAGKHGCEDCHGPGSAHVEAGGDPTKIIRFEALSPQQASARCLSCHSMNTEHLNFERSVHLKNGTGCLSCHSPHKAKVARTLLIQEQPELCYTCHQQQKAQFAMPFHHRVNEHLIKCTDCHNPHGANTPRQLRASDAGFAVCFKCHADKEGPFTFEHMPVKTEGCTACHTPHGSTNPRMLRVSQVNMLCLQCHTPSVTSTAPGTPTFHNQAAKYQACTMCHTQIHGSDLSPVFFK